MSDERRRVLAGGVLLALLALVLFGMTFRTDLYFDDAGYIRFSPFHAKPWAEAVSGVLSRDYFSVTEERTYQPLASLLNRALRARLPLARALGALLHAASALLVGLIVRRAGGAGRAAAAASLLFLLHPASSETVFFLSFRGHLLGALSALACLWGYAVWDAGGRGAARGLALSLAALALGLASKETALTGPLFCAAYALLLGRRTRARAARALAAHAGLGLAYLAWRFGALVQPPPIGHGAPWSPASTVGWLVGKSVWPAPLCLMRPPPSASWAALLPAAAAAAWALRARPLARLGAAMLLLAFLPYATPFGSYSPVADRYLYLAAAGMAVLLADLLSEGPARVALAALVLAWGSQLTARNGELRDPLLVADRTVACSPEHPQAWSLRGFTRLLSGRAADAVADYREAVRLAPWDTRFADGLMAAGAASGDEKALAEGRERKAAILSGAR